jgi:hypothetical protein
MGLPAIGVITNVHLKSTAVSYAVFSLVRDSPKVLKLKNPQISASLIHGFVLDHVRAINVCIYLFIYF